MPTGIPKNKNRNKNRPATANLDQLEERIQEKAALFARECTRMVLQQALEALGGPIVQPPSNGRVAEQPEPKLIETATPLPPQPTPIANGAKDKYKDASMIDAITDVLQHKQRSFPKEVADELKAHGYPFQTKAPQTTVAQRLYDMTARKLVVGKEGTIPGTNIRVKWYSLRQ